MPLNFRFWSRTLGGASLILALAGCQPAVLVIPSYIKSVGVEVVQNFCGCGLCSEASDIPELEQGTGHRWCDRRLTCARYYLCHYRPASFAIAIILALEATR